jgi:hypothetical protein
MCLPIVAVSTTCSKQKESKKLECYLTIPQLNERAISFVSNGA